MSFQHIKKKKKKKRVKEIIKKPGPVKHSFVWVSNCMPKCRKTNDPVPRNCVDWETNRQDGHTIK